MSRASSRVAIGAALVLLVAGTAYGSTNRIFVAGFLVEDDGSFDANAEAARLLRAALRRQGVLDVIEAEPVRLQHAALLADDAYWRVLGEEYGAQRIATGTLKLKRAPPRVSSRSGWGGMYVVDPGYFLEVVLISGTTGQLLAIEPLARKVRYGSGRYASPAMLYRALLDEAMPELARAVIRR